MQAAVVELVVLDLQSQTPAAAVRLNHNSLSHLQRITQ
jgi:hypothetical protein